MSSGLSTVVLACLSSELHYNLFLKCREGILFLAQVPRVKSQALAAGYCPSLNGQGGSGGWPLNLKHAFQREIDMRRIPQQQGWPGTCHAPRAAWRAAVVYPGDVEAQWT